MGLASVLGALWLRGQIFPELAQALAIFAGGAVAAGTVSTAITLRFGLRLPHPARIALAIVLLGSLTCAFDVLFLYLHYIAYYSEWWPEPLSAHWFFTAITTYFGVAFYFGSVGAPMLLPFGVPTMLLMAWRLAQRR